MHAGCDVLCVCFTQLPELGVRFTLLSGTLLVGGAHSLLGYSPQHQKHPMCIVVIWRSNPCRFSPEFPSKIVFIVLSIAARIVQGIGIAATATTALTIVTALFPSSIGTSMVSVLLFVS